MTFHYVEFQTYCHATESLSKVKDAVRKVAGEEIDIEISEAEGYYGNLIRVLKGKISRNQEMDQFFERLPEKVIRELKKSLKRRIDERCNFYFRLGKEKVYEDDIALDSGGNVIKIRARVESYPSRRETAIEKMEEYLGEKLG